jgi:phosphatidyl-myo-inositol dimannoside synthase
MHRLLMITRNFPPLVGGMERLNHHLYQQLQSCYSVDLIGPEGCIEYCNESSRIFESPVHPVSTFLTSSLLKALWLALRRRPDAILSGSGLTAPAAVLAGKIAGIPAITYLHGLDLVVDNRLYRNLFVPMIRLSDRVIANSSNTARLAKEAGIAVDRIDVIHPGVDTAHDIFPENCFRSRFGLKGKRILLSVGRLIPRKGLAEFIRFSLPGIVSIHPDTVLVVIGGEATDALKKDHTVLDQIKSNIELNDLGDHVVLAGRVDEETLQAAYAESDLCVFPLLEVHGDVEGFGMVAMEAAARGLPTVAFSIGGVVDAITPGRSGFLVEPANYDAFSNTCNAYLANQHPEVTKAACREFAADFHWDVFGRKLRHTLEKTISREVP